MTIGSSKLQSSQLKRHKPITDLDYVNETVKVETKEETNH